MNQENHILVKAKEVFFRLGIKSVTMDDLARELGVSKKTIYKHVANKSDLVRLVMLDHLEEEKRMMRDIVKNHDNAVDEMIATIRKVINHLRIIHPSSIYDIQKYYPKSWLLFHNYKNDFIYKCILANLEKGIAQELYKPNLEPKIIAKLYIGLVDYIVNPKNFPNREFNLSSVYEQFINYHLHGVVSEKGNKYLKKIDFNVSN